MNDIEREAMIAALKIHRDVWRAKAETLRSALEGLYEYERKRHPPKMGGDHYPPSLRSLMDAARMALEEGIQ